MKKLFLLVLMQIMSVMIYAQSIKVSGVVYDENDLPIPGTNVVVKGTTNGTATDFDGKFTISVPNKQSTLVISFLGYSTQEVVVGNKKSFQIKMQADFVGLDEVVAVGYGYKKKSVVTGAISSLDSDDLLQSKPASVAQALGGRAAGVVVSQSSGQPGASNDVFIRGVGTNGDSSPLYIVDGLQMSDIGSINPADIKSLEVLKDATSTAIYGARGANGVILIETKTGEKGKSSISYNSFVGWQSAFNVPDMMNTNEYLELTKEFYSNDGTEYPEVMPSENLGVDTNWFDEINQTAMVQEHNVSATAGSDKGSILLSLGYREQNGIIGGDKSYFKRYSARANGILDVTDFISVGANINYTFIDKNGVSTGTNGYNPVYYAMQMDPTTPVYDPNSDDNLGFGATTVPFTRMINPLAFMDSANNGFNYSNRIFGNTFLKFEPIKNLVFKTDFAINMYDSTRRSYQKIYYHNSSAYQDENAITQATNKSTYWQWENTLNYNIDLGKHSVGALLGTTASRSYSEWFNARRKNLPLEAQENDNYWYLTSGEIGTETNDGGGTPVHTLASVFSRVSYDYDDKYIAELVVRRDGSSNFGPKNKYAIFPGVSFGWNVSSEDFWDVKNFDFLKARVSWGQNGNEAIDPFMYTSLIVNDRNYNFNNGSIVTGSSPNSLVNPDVKWETSEQFDIGADMAFFGSKLRASVDYYTKTTKDLLFRRTMEKVRGNNAPYYNLGEVSNKGVELQLGYNQTIGEVQISVNANVNYLKNEVVSVGNENGYEDGMKWQGTIVTTRMEEGYPMGHFYGYKVDGIFQNQNEINSYVDAEGNLTYPDAVPGDFRWNDKDGNGIINADDKQDIGNPWPKWTYGVNLSANWKGLDASVFINGKADVDVFMAHYRTEAFGRANLPSFYLDRWQQAGDDNGIPRVSVLDKNGSLKNASDFWIRDASFMKIGTIELGYSLPKNVVQHAKLKGLRFYVAIDNAAIFTKYPMFDPEVGSMEGGVLNTGMDYSMYPQARTIRTGLSLDL